MDNPGENIGVFKCTKCVFVTKYKSNLLRHMVRHDRETENDSEAALSCDACGQVFTNKYNCIRHKKLRCPKNPSAGQLVCHSGQSVCHSGQLVCHSGQLVCHSGQSVSQSCTKCIPDDYDDNDADKKGFPCPTCYKVFPKESRRIAHIPKCKHVQSPLECPKCNKVLSCKASKCKHLKRCKVTQMSPISNPSSVINATTSYNATNMTNNTTNNNIQNQFNNTININGLGKENLSCLTPDFLAKQALRIGSQGAMECIKAIHFNPQYPENHNIRLLANDDIDDHFVAVYDDDKWDIRDFACTVSDVLQHICMILKDRAGQQDFQKKYEDHWMAICERLNTLTRVSNPHDFYIIMRTMKLLLKNIEKVEV